MREVGVLEAKTHLSALLDAVERDGQEITITRHGRAVARLGPPAEAGRSLPRPSGKEMLARSKALREQIARDNPNLGVQTWEELKEIARR